jgi:hypothetical protein
LSDGVTASSTATRWQRLIRDLQSVGYTYERIAIECQLRGVDYSPQAVKFLALGRREKPFYDTGEVIVSLHTRAFKTTIRSE